MSTKTLEKRVATKTRTQIKKFFKQDIDVKVTKDSASITFKKGNVKTRFEVDFLREEMENRVIEMIGTATVHLSAIENYSSLLEKVTNEIRKIFIKEK